MPVKILLIPYLITAAAETIAAILCGIRKPLELFKILLINTITNPTVNLLFFIMQIYLPYRYRPAELFVLEAAVFISEGWMFRFFLEWKTDRTGWTPWRLSLIFNITSYLSGEILKLVF